MSSTNNIPNLETLFGATPFCECDECNSALSMNAYLVDFIDAILAKKISVTASGKTLSGLDLLTAWPKNGGALGERVPRRPDVVELLLNCDNNRIRVLYIDPVLEIMENAVSPGTLQTSTTGTEDELASNPQYVNENAYSTGPTDLTVATAVYPWSLPFDLWLSEARLYLNQLGVSRSDLMSALLLRNSGEGLDEYETRRQTQISVAAEYLGLSAAEVELIAGRAPVNPGGPWLCWGIANKDQANWDATIGKLSIKDFLQLTQLEYNDLLDLLPTHTMNPGGPQAPNRIDFDNGNCDLQATHLTGITPIFLDTFHRFVRLTRKLDWTSMDLDQTITAFGGSIDDSLLLRVCHVQKLKKRLSIPTDELLSWWSNMETLGDQQRENSLYVRVFQNKSVRRLTAPAVDPFDLTQPDRAELAQPQPNAISPDVLPALLAAVGLTTPDYGLLRDAQEIPVAFTLASLSRAFRITSFCSAAKLTVREYLSCRSLFSDPGQPHPLDPFDPKHTEQSIQFLDEIDRIRHAGFTINDLDFLLRGVKTAVGNLNLTTDKVVNFLDDVRQGLKKIGTSPPVASDSTGEILRAKIGAYLPDLTLNEVMAIAMGSSAKTAADQTSALLQAFSFLGDSVAKQLGADLVPGPATPPDRFARILVPILAHEWRLQRRAFVLGKFKSFFAVDNLTKTLDTGIIEKLTTGGDYGRGAVPAVLDATQAAISDFLVEGAAFADFEQGLDALLNVPRSPGRDLTAAVGDVISAGTVPAAKFACVLAQAQSLDVTRKIAACLNRLSVTTEEIPWILKNGIRDGWQGWLDPENFRGKKSNYAAFRELLRLLEVRSAFPPGTVFNTIALVDLKKALGEIQQFMAEQTHWPVADIQKIASSDVLNLSANDWGDPKALSLVLAAMLTVRRLGAAAATAVSWSQGPVTSLQSRAIKDALKARIDADTWLKQTGSMQNQLRESRRDALLAFHLAHSVELGLPFFRNPAAISSYFLIDSQMSSCQTITRISQAIGAVQLFVQRCQMGLESYPDPAGDVPVVINADAIKQLEWMGTFQLWVAARKVFLHPETYLHWDLLDVRSPALVDLQNQLLQGDITADSAENAFRVYLEKLDEIARLEIVSIFHEPATANSLDVLHVLGRTTHEPFSYFYRTRTIRSDGADWSFWEKMDLDIQSDCQLLTLRWERGLCAFWPVFKQKQDEPKAGADLTTAQPARKHWEIQLAFSEYRNGKWSKKKLASGFLMSPPSIDPPDTSEFLFKTGIDQQSGELVITCMINNGWAEFRGTGTGSIAARKGKFWLGSDFELTLSYGNLQTLPDGTSHFGQFLVEGSNVTWLSLPIPNSPDLQDVLWNTPSRFSLTYPNTGDFLFNDEFFYQDAKRTFLVAPKVQPIVRWYTNKIDPALLVSPALSKAAFTRPAPLINPLERFIHFGG